MIKTEDIGITRQSRAQGSTSYGTGFKYTLASRRVFRPQEPTTAEY